MFRREDYMTIIKIALFEFGFDIMMHVVIFIIAWDIWIHVIISKDEEDDTDNVFVSNIRCNGETKEGCEASKKDVKYEAMKDVWPGESQAKMKDDSNDDTKMDVEIELDVKRQEESKEEHGLKLQDNDNVVVRDEEVSNDNKQGKMSLNDRVERSFMDSMSRIRYSGRVMINGVNYFNECKTSISWSCYVVEGSNKELLRIRFDKKRKSMTSTVTKGMINELQEVVTFDKEDVVEILTNIKRLCKIKRQ